MRNSIKAIASLALVIALAVVSSGAVIGLTGDSPPDSALTFRSAMIADDEDEDDADSNAQDEDDATTATASATATATPEIDALALYDDDGNGMISCAEARAHVIAPVHSDHPAYPYMNDADGDGVVC